MTGHEFLRALDKDNLKVWKRGGRRAPHKPLLLLLALGRIAQRKPRLASYSDEIEPKLKDLLVHYGPRRRSLHPEDPFGRLVGDDLWEIPGVETLPTTSAGTLRVTPLRQQGVRGGFPPYLDRLLRGDAELVETAAARLLVQNFPESSHASIRDAVGLPDSMALEAMTLYGEKTVKPRRRDPDFRRRVLTAYERRCAICDFDVRLNDDLLGLDAAHIKWHAAGGPDRVPNGLALCTLHHRALDRGAIGLEGGSSAGFVLLVSNEVTGVSDAYHQLVDARGRPLRPPQESAHLPDAAFVAWHRREVFRGEPRSR